MSIETAASSNITTIIQSAMTDPALRLIVVLSLIALVAAFVHHKWYTPDQKVQLQLKKEIEENRTKQVEGLKEVSARAERMLVLATDATTQFKELQTRMERTIESQHACDCKTIKRLET